MHGHNDQVKTTLRGIQIQKEVISNPKQPKTVTNKKKKSVALKKAMVKKICEIQGG